MKRSLIVAGILIVVILGIGGVYFFSQSSSPQTGFSSEIPQNTHVVTITEKGFSPSTITIKKGELVTWVNNDMKPHWPASNLHPTHELYSEFDPQEPMDPKQIWRFQFERKGSWKYHDHLAPSMLGTITVE